MIYTYVITETLQKVVAVETDSSCQAKKDIESKLESGELIINHKDNHVNYKILGKPAERLKATSFIRYGEIVGARRMDDYQKIMDHLDSLKNISDLYKN